MNRVSKLISVAGEPLAKSSDMEFADLSKRFGGIGKELQNMLMLKNGWYGFESALHVFPCGEAKNTMDAMRWNSADLWKADYGTLPDIYCFAEDVFGDQFCIYEGAIYTFESETGSLEHIADSINQWCGMILNDYATLTGYPIAHEWQILHGAIRDGLRLLPKVPFIGGGEFVVSNLVSVDAVEAMRYKGAIAKQIRHLPDGAKIRIDWVD